MRFPAQAPYFTRRRIRAAIPVGSRVGRFRLICGRQNNAACSHLIPVQDSAPSEFAFQLVFGEVDDGRASVGAAVRLRSFPELAYQGRHFSIG